MSTTDELKEVPPTQTEEAGRTAGLKRVPMTDPLHWEIVEFLEDEAATLDDNSLMEWMEFLAPDILYRMPVRTTRDRIDGSEFEGGMYLFDENFDNLRVKIIRLAATQTAWAEKPPSRTRRCINNVRVFGGRESEAEYEVRSNVLMVRNRYDKPAYEVISARRTDILRRTDEGFKIANREIFSDQASLGTQNLAVFL